jgi:hypothetical protein
MIKLFESQESTERIDAAADSIIFSDGTFTGPDSANRVKTLDSELRASADLFSKLDGLKGEDLRKQLRFHAALDATDTYTRARLVHAKAILRIFDERGEAAALISIQNRMRPQFDGGGSLRRKE